MCVSVESKKCKIKSSEAIMLVGVTEANLA